MDRGPQDARYTAISAGLVIGGTIAAPIVSFVGVPLAAFGLAVLAFGGKGLLAGIISAVGVAVVTFLDPSAALFVAPVLVVVLVSLPWLRHRSALSIASVYVAVITMASIVADAVGAFLAGTTLVERVHESVELTVEQVTLLTGGAGLGDAGTEVVDLWSDLMVRTWPLGYFETALITGLLVVAGVVLGARRSGVEVNRLPRLRDVDLSVHVLWPFVAGLLCLAAERFLGEQGRFAGTVGLNLLLGARWLFFVQGMAVGAALLERRGAGRVGTFVGYVLMVVADTLFYMVSVIGLLDFWMNFRRIERADGKTGASLEGPLQ